MRITKVNPVPTASSLSCPAPAAIPNAEASQMLTAVVRSFTRPRDMKIVPAAMETNRLGQSLHDTKRVGRLTAGMSEMMKLKRRHRHDGGAQGDQGVRSHACRVAPPFAVDAKHEAGENRQA